MQLRMLLAVGADPNAFSRNHSSGIIRANCAAAPPLYFALHADADVAALWRAAMVRALLCAGADPNALAPHPTCFELLGLPLQECPLILSDLL